MTRLGEIAEKAKQGEELTQEEAEYVANLLLKMSDLIEQTIEWLRPIAIQVVAIWLEAAKRLEEDQV